jgi:hypothetical protein
LSDIGAPATLSWLWQVVQRESSTLRTLQYGVLAVAVDGDIDVVGVVVGVEPEPAAPDFTGSLFPDDGVLGFVDAGEPARPVGLLSSVDSASCELQAPQMEANPNTNATLDFDKYLGKPRCIISNLVTM